MKIEDFIRQYNSAIKIAIKAHDRQLDKAGMYYFSHPMRVSKACVSYEAKIAALLHDVVEDTELTLKDLERAGFCHDVIYALEKLTKDKQDSYMDYIKRIALDPVAKEVKIADLRDNLDVTRIPYDLTDDDLKRIVKYHAAYLYLMEFERDQKHKNEHEDFRVGPKPQLHKDFKVGPNKKPRR